MSVHSSLVPRPHLLSTCVTPLLCAELVLIKEVTLDLSV